MSSDVAWTRELAKVNYYAYKDREKVLSRFLALAEKLRSTEKSHNGVRCHAWKICADEIEALVKEITRNE